MEPVKRANIPVFQNTKDLVDDFMGNLHFKTNYDDVVRIAIKRMIRDFNKEGLNVLHEPENESLNAAS